MALGFNTNTREFNAGGERLEEINHHCGTTLAVKVIGLSGSELHSHPPHRWLSPTAPPFSTHSFDLPTMLI